MTTSENKRQEMILIYSDFYKDAYGVRPRGINYHEFTLEELEADFNSFSKVCKENARIEKEANERAIADFEAKVQTLINMGANDRKTALRWIVESYEAHDLYYGADWLVSYELGIGYNKYADELKVEFQPLIATYLKVA